MTPNQAKCSFDKESLCFYVYELSKNGISVDQKKIDAIVTMQAHSDVNQLRSFLGLVNYCERFIQSLATITAPLRELTMKGAPWTWEHRHQTAFEAIKKELEKDCTMAFYNPEHKSLVTVDASPVGVGAILFQFDNDGNERIVAYASRALTQVEQKYSQTEKEALAVVYGSEKFHIYLVGAEFELDTDHKPLEVIYNPKSKPPARIERWTLRLQQYQFKLKHRPGKTNPADVLSRQPIQKIFSVHGFPRQFVSDNGPPYNGHDFHNYLHENGIQHRKVTPLWPQANGEVERFMRTLQKAIPTAHAEGKNWKTCMYDFLLSYRTPPHATTGVAPAELLFKRTVRTKLPDFAGITSRTITGEVVNNAFKPKTETHDDPKAPFSSQLVEAALKQCPTTVTHIELHI